MKSLYKWQQACLEAWEQNAYRGIVHVATGAGKTVLALAAIERLKAQHPNLRVRVVVPTIALANQWKQHLLRQAADAADLPGFCGGGQRDTVDRAVMIYVLASARKALSKHMRADLALGRPILLICDECHHLPSQENRHVFDFVTSAVLQGSLYCTLGLSATPFSDPESAAYLQGMLGREIYRYSVDHAMRDRVVAPYTICSVGTDFLPEEREEYQELTRKLLMAWQALCQREPSLRTYSPALLFPRIAALAKQAGDDGEHPAVQWLQISYRRKEVSLLAQSRTQCCLDLLERLHAEDKTLIFCERIEQATALHQMLRAHFGAAYSVLYHSGMNRAARMRNMDAFREGRSRVLVACRCLDEGLDVPDANIAIVLSSTSVQRQRVQRLGRIIRCAEGKDAACLYYIYIRSASDDCVYLTGLGEEKCFDLQYAPLEHDFTNDLYEYAALDLWAKAQRAGWRKANLQELRRCLREGLTRADYLLPSSALAARAAQAAHTAERNYWHTMCRMADYYQIGEDDEHEL